MSAWIVSLLPLAIAAQQRARIVRRFADAGAVSPETARRLEELSLTPDLTIQRMVGEHVLKESTPGRLWLDQSADHAVLNAKRRRGLSIALIAAIVLGVAGLGIAVALLVR